MGRFPDCFVTVQFISHNDIPSLCPEKTKADLFPNNKGKWQGCMKLLPYFQWVSARLLGIFEHPNYNLPLKQSSPKLCQSIEHTTFNLY